MTLDLRLMRPHHLATLEGQLFLVLKTPSPLYQACIGLRNQIRSRLARLPISYPDPHLTLGAFPESAQTDAVDDLVTLWSRDIERLTLEVDDLCVFPPPYKSIAVCITRTKRLLDALRSLRALAREYNLNIARHVPISEWIFHMSLAYCAELTHSEWEAVLRAMPHLPLQRLSGDVISAELLTISAGRTRTVRTYRMRHKTL